MRSLTRIPRLRRRRPAIDASLDRVAAHDDPPQARPRTKTRKARSDGSGNRPTRPQPIWDPNPISKTRSGSSQRAGGEQCTPVLVKVRHGLMTSDLLLGGAAVATTAHQCTPIPEKGRYRLTTSGLRLTTSCSRWTKPGVCVRLTRMTVSESDVGLPQKRKSGDVNDDPVLAARDGRTSGQKPESQIEPGA